MLVIRYSAPFDLDFSGTVEVLQRVRKEILALIKSDLPQISFEAEPTIDPAPYALALSRLVIAQGHGPVRISLKPEKEIYIEGEPQCLENLASFFDFAVETETGPHSHYEYYEGNEWIAPDSIPLVISVKE